jgi:hypothetical protein
VQGVGLNHVDQFAWIAPMNFFALTWVPKRINEPTSPFECAEARDSAEKLRAANPLKKLLASCLDQSPAASSNIEMNEVISAFLDDPDAENRYWNATIMAYLRK